MQKDPEFQMQGQQHCRLSSASSLDEARQSINRIIIL